MTPKQKQMNSDPRTPETVRALSARLHFHECERCRHSWTCYRDDWPMDAPDALLVRAPDLCKRCRETS